MRRIPVVDDDQHTRLAIGAWLSRYGFRVAMTDGSASGPAALGEASFDLMVFDAFMPNMRGFTPAALLALINECLTEARRDCPGVAKTG